MPLHRDVELLEEKFKQKVMLFLKELDERRIKYVINETKRDIEVQKAYFAQGREPLVITNRLRREAGLPEITEKENRKKITWTMKSKHLDGLAIDVVPLNTEMNKPYWNAPDVRWKEIADIAGQYGLCSGYYWRDQKDSPHIEG